MPHTPEPWRSREAPGRAAEVYGADGKTLVATCPAMGETYWIAPDNARRITAAVNACAGLPTPALERGVVRDLLSACEALLKCEHERIRRSQTVDPAWTPEDGGGLEPDYALYAEAVRLAREAVSKATLAHCWHTN